ncbi:MAG: thiamine phosphate synthase [Sulfuricurvum sp.]
MQNIQSYFITDPKYYGQDQPTLQTLLENVYRKGIPDFALYRDKVNPTYETFAQIFIKVSRQHAVSRILLHGDYVLAHELGANGVHLTSTQFDSIMEAKRLGLYVIISTHTHDEALNAKRLGADAITYSPIFASPGKGEPKGLEDLKELVATINIPVFALGGIVTEEQIKAVEECGVYGFASIRYFLT